MAGLVPHVLTSGPHGSLGFQDPGRGSLYLHYQGSGRQPV